VADDRQKPEIDTTSISLDREVLEAGRRRAAQLFPEKRVGTFSGYVESLIRRDLEPAALRESPTPYGPPLRDILREIIRETVGEVIRDELNSPRWRDAVGELIEDGFRQLGRESESRAESPAARTQGSGPSSPNPEQASHQGEKSAQD
jgi:hypothetical protein